MIQVHLDALDMPVTEMCLISRDSELNSTKYTHVESCPKKCPMRSIPNKSSVNYHNVAVVTCCMNFQVCYRWFDNDLKWY